MNIHCLVQVNGNELDFAEWLDYHIALGFDAIFVFNNGNHPWLNAVCERRADKNVVIVPGDDDWSRQSTIVEKFVARRKQPSWAICLSDDEFIWLDPKLYRGVKDFVFGEAERRGATACTLYTKYISSKEPMKSRVGTQIDCFTHVRREPEGYVPPMEVCPNTGATFFKITGPEMPLVNKLVPRDVGRWMDGNGNRLLPEEMDHYVHSSQFFPMRYRARIYRFCPKSGFEMNFAENAVPKGFDIQDLSMQEARSLLMRVPVNPDTESLFAKDIIPVPPAVVENSNGTTSEISREELAERELPVSKAKICKMILSGKYFEDIRDEVTAKFQDVDVEALERVFNKEREAILQADTSYKWLQELLDEGKTEEEICKTMFLKHTAYTRMVKALPVLDIPRETSGEEEETVADPGLKLEVGEPESMEDLAAAFNESVESTKMTELEKQEIDNFEEARSAKKATGKKNRKKESKKETRKPKVVAVEVDETQDEPDGNVIINDVVPPGSDADDFHIDVDSDLIDSASSDAIMKHVEKQGSENA